MLNIKLKHFKATHVVTKMFGTEFVKDARRPLEKFLLEMTSPFCDFDSISETEHTIKRY